MNCLQDEVCERFRQNLTCSHPGVSSAPSPKRNLPNAGKSLTAISEFNLSGSGSARLILFNFKSLMTPARMFIFPCELSTSLRMILGHPSYNSKNVIDLGQ